jgi:hypothetical protein
MERGKSTEDRSQKNLKRSVGTFGDTKEICWWRKTGEREFAVS